MTKTEPFLTCQGGCHCGAVRFEIDIPRAINAHRCNCSICSRSGFLHVFVSANEFRLHQGSEELTEYQFHTRTARHLFCRICGVKSFYVPRSHPDGFSVNLRCIDLDDTVKIEIHDFDGRNWSARIQQLRSESDPAGPD
jgi:hypothetical protein